MPFLINTKRMLSRPVEVVRGAPKAAKMDCVARHKSTTEGLSRPLLSPRRRYSARALALTPRVSRAGGLRAGVRRPPPCRTAGKTTGRESSRCGRRACSAHPRTGASVSHLTTPSPVSQPPSQLAAARATVGSLVSLGLPCGWLACDWCPAPPWRCPTARHLIACAHLLMFVCVQAATRARGGCR